MVIIKLLIELLLLKIIICINIMIIIVHYCLKSIFSIHFDMTVIIHNGNNIHYTHYIAVYAYTQLFLRHKLIYVKSYFWDFPNF